MYGYNLFKALDDVFPGIDLQRLKFQYLRMYYRRRGKRRKKRKTKDIKANHKSRQLLAGR